MKRVLLILTAVVLVIGSSCSSNKKMAAAQLSTGGAPFGKTYSLPCEVKDSRDKFAATGIYRGSSYQKGQCHLNAIANAQAIIREKYHHSYNGMISDYSSTIGNNRGNDISTKLERAGDAVIDIMLNDAFEVCSQFSEVFDDGMIECYVAIEIDKGEIATNVSKTVADVLTQEEKDRIKFDEYNFRKQMEERMKNYKEEKQ